MARALGRGKKGKAWGNALGGFRRQRRDAMGRFGNGAGTPTRAPSARAQKKYAKAQARQDRKDADNLIRSMNVPRPKNQKLRKDKNTSLLKAQNRSQQQFRTGALKRQAGFVPYTKVGFANKSAGVNTGIRVLPNYRISGGAYLKVTNIDKTKREKAFRKADNAFMNDMTNTISPHPIADGLVKNKLAQFRRSMIDKVVGGEKRVANGAYARVTTDMNAMPSLTVEYNRKDPRTNRRKRQSKARRKAQWQYNDMVTKSRGTNVNSRAQRRGQ